jgi:hypothetical protein
MNYRLLTLEDAPAYLNHLNAVYDSKGLLSVKDPEWVELQRAQYARIEVVSRVLDSEQDRVWVGEEDGRIIDSMRTQTWKFIPSYTIHNFKTVRTTMFNPHRSMFPMWDYVLRQYETMEFYSAYYARPLDWMTQRRVQRFHEHAPMNRYHATFEQVIRAGSVPQFLKFKSLLPEPMPIDMVIVSLHLHQELRSFDNRTMGAFL